MRRRWTPRWRGCSRRPVTGSAGIRGTGGWRAGWRRRGSSRPGSTTPPPARTIRSCTPTWWWLTCCTGWTGAWSALDTRGLHRAARTAGFVYQAVLRGQLTARSGLGWGGGDPRHRRGRRDRPAPPAGVLQAAPPDRDRDGRRRQQRAGRRAGRVPGHPGRQDRSGPGPTCSPRGPSPRPRPA